jgi:hypothetical protein
MAADAALGRATVDPPVGIDQALLRLPVPSLLSDAADHAPVLLIVDDLDDVDSGSAGVLVWVVRQMVDELVVAVFATAPSVDVALRWPLRHQNPATVQPALLQVIYRVCE